MKRIIAAVTAAVLSTTMFYGTVLAEETSSAQTAITETAASETALPEVSVTSTEATETAATDMAPSGTVQTPTATEAGEAEVVSIAPDNILYSVKRLIESLQVALTFTPEGKAELLVSLAGERLTEAELMIDRNKQKIAVEVVKAYAKTMEAAKEELEKASGSGTDMVPALENISIVEASAERFIIKVTGILPAESSEELVSAVKEQVKSTLAVQAFILAKDELRDAASAVKDAKEALKVAKQSGDAEMVLAAMEKLELADQEKAAAESVKDEVEAFKEEVKKSSESTEDPDASDEEAAEQPDAVKLQQKIDHMQSVIDMQRAKRESQIKKHSGQPGKASGKMKENWDKQFEKRTAKLEVLKSVLAAISENSADSALDASTGTEANSAEAIISQETKITYDSVIMEKDNDTEEKDSGYKSGKEDKGRNKNKAQYKSHNNK